MQYFVTCPKGIEAILQEEVKALGAGDIEIGRGGVRFEGDREILYRANLELRTAVRVLMPIFDGPAHSPEELYENAKTIDWAAHLTLDHTFAIDCNVRDSAITHSQYAAQVTKDAICDQFVQKTGRRPSVDLRNPSILINLHIFRNNMVLSLDASGDSLHKRGYRPVQTRAPLNEALAAAIVQMMNWDMGGPFLDPMCGSGTFCIEACWWATDRPPGLTRKRFAFQSWLDYDVKLWTGLRDAARDRVKKSIPAPILGSDKRSDAIFLSEKNAKSAGVGHLMKFSKRDIEDLERPDGPPGVIVCNPPYGRRIGEEKEVSALYPTMGEVFGKRFHGYRLYILSANPLLEQSIRMRPAAKTPLFNGGLPCKLLEYRL